MSQELAVLEIESGVNDKYGLILRGIVKSVTSS